jgi:magnesium chelatase subunit D
MDAVRAAALFAVDPAGTGGVLVRALAGPVRDTWLAQLRGALPAETPVKRIPAHVTDDRLLGGLDLAATLQAGRPVAQRGLLAEADGGVAILAMAERITVSAAARVTAALDTGAVAVERDGLALRLPARIGVVALDEGMTDDERPPAALAERLAFHVDLTGVGAYDTARGVPDADFIAAARARLPGVTAGADVLEALCATALTLGIDSIRAPLLALRVARAAAALGGRDAVTEADAALAGRLVFAARATTLPAPPEAEAQPPEPPPEAAEPPSDSAEQENATQPEGPLEDVVLAAALAAMPPGQLALLKLALERRGRAKSAGRAGARQHARLRGRPAGIRRGDPRAGSRMNVIATLTAAAPWQPLRRREREAAGLIHAGRIDVRSDDFRITRFKSRTQTTTVFVVDASGSSALHRLAEAKGAVEHLLAECYVRRDRVALIAFRGAGAELLLPPTRSLVRAKRSLAGLPGGGGTPLAAGLDAAAALADAVRRRGDTPVVVVLTDGRANVARDGAPGRERAEADAFAAARGLQALQPSALLLDTSPRPQALAGQLAVAMGARYLALPHADGATVSRAVRVANGAPA